MPKVFIINKGRHNYTDAEKYGELVSVSEGSIDKYNPDKIYRDFYEVLNNSTPEDFLLLSGLALVNSIATGIMVALHGKVNYLIFHQRKSNYIKKDLTFIETVEAKDAPE